MRVAAGRALANPFVAQIEAGDTVVMDESRVAVVGGGVFGVAAAIALRDRHHQVSLFDPGPLPHPLAESTDISKVVRLDYGADAEYTALGERALAGWRAWNDDWAEPVFHETGVTFLSRRAMAPGSFEYESHRLLSERGHALERLDAAEIARRFPAWAPGAYVDGYFNPAGGWAEASKVVRNLLAEAAREGVNLLEGQRFHGLLERGSRVAGVITDAGTFRADVVVIAAGAWTPHLLPDLSSYFRTVAQPVFHLKPADPSPFRGPRFPVFGADISQTGWYGFPANADGIVKIANHGAGQPMHPSSTDRAVGTSQQAQLRKFLEGTFPDLASAPLVHTRQCVYCDTLDEHFWIAPDPERQGLVVATGGSGHGFKFAPVLGELIADIVEGKDNALARKFRWRPGGRGRGEEAARHHGR